MERKAEARWEGALKTGKGHIKLGSGAYDGAYSFSTRFETSPGTNPEELIGAALAACYSMALAASLERGGYPATRVESTAAVQLEKTGEGFGITRIDITTRGTVPGVSPDEFRRLAEQTGKSCIIARAIAAPITVNAALAGG